MRRLLTACLCMAALVAQDQPQLAQIEAPVRLPQDVDAGLARIERGGNVVQLRIAPIGPVDSPMIEVPVVGGQSDWRFATTKDRRFLVGLAGGIRDDLELYLIDRQRARWLRYPTSGGRLLPDRFMDGLGSWPQLQGAHAALFAFARHGRTELCVLDFEGRVLATASLPEDLAGIDYRFLPESYEFEVGFRGAADPLRVPHPMAPWLEIVEPSVEFGDVPLSQRADRELNLRNRGRSRLRLTWTAPEPPFEILTGDSLELEPDASAKMRLRFALAVAGPAQALLRLATNGPLRRTSVLLRGVGAAAAAEQPAAVVPPPPKTEPVASESGRPPVVRPLPVPALQREGDRILVRCSPAQEFLLTAISADGVGRMLGVWRGRADVAGAWTVPLAQLAGEGEAFELVLLWQEAGRLRRSEPLLVR